MRRLKVDISATGIFSKLTGAIFAHRRTERKSAQQAWGSRSFTT
jgi:hypothetical protein